jgi:hypothetical protein
MDETKKSSLVFDGRIWAAGAGPNVSSPRGEEPGKVANTMVAAFEVTGIQRAWIRIPVV